MQSYNGTGASKHGRWFTCMHVLQCYGHMFVAMRELASIMYLAATVVHIAKAIAALVLIVVLSSSEHRVVVIVLVVAVLAAVGRFADWYRQEC